MNPFHFYKPSRFGGLHRSIGRDLSKFNLYQAAQLVAYRERNKLIEAFQNVGNKSQRRYILGLFLSNKSVIDDTNAVLHSLMLQQNESIGMVHAWVAQKLLKRDILRVFTMSLFKNI